MSLLLGMGSYAKPKPIAFWHAMPGIYGQALQDFAADFNAHQSNYIIQPVYKGDYNETLTITVSAFRAKQQPAIVQIFEIGTNTMINPPGIIKPLYQLLNTDEYNWLPLIKAYYADTSGRLLALPLSASTPMVFANKKALSRVGLTAIPKTWPGLLTLTRALRAAGYECGFTTGYPSWVHIESLSTWHNQPLATGQNGFAGLNATLLLDNPLVRHHLRQLQQATKDGLYTYGGRGSNATALFTSGKCPLFITSSASIAGLKSVSDFDIALGPYPYWPTFTRRPQNTSLGGAALWVLSGHDDKTYAGVAAFFEYLLTAKVQQRWQKLTSYLPIMREGRDNNIALNTLTKNPPTQHSRGVRMGFYPQIRQAQEDMLEAVISGQQTLSEAISKTERRANRLLKRFREQSREKTT